jgi:hypothetical protein
MTWLMTVWIVYSAGGESDRMRFEFQSFAPCQDAAIAVMRAALPDGHYIAVCTPRVPR